MNMGYWLILVHIALAAPGQPAADAAVPAETSAEEPAPILEEGQPSEPDVVTPSPEEPTEPVREAVPALPTASGGVIQVQQALARGEHPRAIVATLQQDGVRFSRSDIDDLKALETPRLILRWARRTAGMEDAPPPKPVVEETHETAKEPIKLTAPASEILVETPQLVPELPSLPPETPLAWTAQPTPSPEHPLVGLMPWFPARGPASGLLLLFFGTVLWFLSRITLQFQLKLRPGGWLTRGLSMFAAILRIGIAVCFLGVLAAWLPAHLAVAIPFVVVAGALALGWSLRDVLPDLTAGAVITIEGHLRPGKWVNTATWSGTVLRREARVTWIQTAEGEVAIPNRLLLSTAVRTDTAKYPPVSIELTCHPDTLGPDPAHTLIQLAALSPWIAPSAPILVDQDPVHPTRWTVHARLLEGHFSDAFKRTLTQRLRRREQPSRDEAMD